MAVGVAISFIAEGRHWPVTGNEGDVFTQRPEAVADGRNQGVEIAPGEIGASDRAPKQHVAHNSQMAGCMKKHDVAWRMSGAVQHVQCDVAELHDVALLEPAIRGKGTCMGEAELHALFRQGVYPVMAVIEYAG